jgi:hypothetical protein
MTDRVYVYQPFVWNPRHEELPLSAFLLGPTKGTISSDVFHQVCPPDVVKHVYIISGTDDLWTRAQEALRTDDHCVVVDNWIFSWRYADIRL